MNRPPTQRGVTLVETLVATLIVAVLGSALGGASHMILATDRAAATGQEVNALGLALLEEIAALPFDDPQAPTAGLGPESGEWNPPADRSLFDDVDDYAVWNSLMRTMQEKDGTPINLSAYHRLVAVCYVDPSDFTATSPEPTDYKRITVTVYQASAPVAAFVTVRVQGGRDVDFDG